MTQKITKM